MRAPFLVFQQSYARDMEGPVERVHGFVGFENPATETRFQEYMSNSDSQATLDRLCLCLGLAILVVFMLIYRSEKGDVSHTVWILAAVLLGIVYMSLFRPAQYMQHRTYLITICKLIRVALMVHFGARAVCWPGTGGTSDGLVDKILQFLVAIQKNGRLAFMIFMVLAGKLSFKLESILQLIVIPVSLSYVSQSCKPECLVGKSTQASFAYFRQILSFIVQKVSSTGEQLPSPDIMTCGASNDQKDCFIALAWLQIMIGCCLPLCICYFYEMVSRLQWAGTEQIVIDPHYDKYTLAVAVTLVWCTLAVASYCLLEYGLPKHWELGGWTMPWL
eukprot:jgi/Botrbrau1/5051/Bobra.37_1s0016.1